MTSSGSRPDAPEGADDTPSDGPGEALEELRQMADDTPSPDAADPRQLLASLKSEMRAQDSSPRGRLQRLPTRGRLAMCLGAALLLAGTVAVVTPRADLVAYPQLRMLAILLLLGGFCVPVAHAALRPWHRRAVSAQRAWSWVAVGVAAALGVSLLPVAHVLLPHTAPPTGEALWQHGSRCLAFGLSVGTPVFLLTWVLGRDTAHSGIVATVLAGLVGNLALQLHCPITEHAHLLVGHGTVGVAALLLLAIPRLTRTA